MEVPERIEVGEEGATLTVEWSDGAIHTWTAARIRDACNCADCRAVAPSPLRLVAPTLTKIVDAQLVGGYGISFVFMPDGHSTGIFSYTQLRSLAE